MSSRALFRAQTAPVLNEDNSAAETFASARGIRPQSVTAAIFPGKLDRGVTRCDILFLGRGGFGFRSWFRGGIRFFRGGFVTAAVRHRILLSGGQT